MEERTRHRAVGAAVLLLAAVVVLPLVLEGSPPGDRAAPDPAQVDLPDSSPDRIRITTFDGAEEGRLSPQSGEEAESPADSTDTSGGDAGSAVPVAGWAVQIGSFADPDNAARLQEQVASRGYRVLAQPVTTQEGKPRVRVLVGPEQTRAHAAAQLTRLRRDDSIQGFLVRYPG